MTTDLILPCLDEAAALPGVLARIPEGVRAIVVDNGSSDGSASVARDCGAVVVHEPRRGFGWACHSGLSAATAEFVAFCDADGSLDPARLPQLVELLAAGEADLVLGRRLATSMRAFPPHARLGNAVIAAWVRRRTGVRIADLGPMRVARRQALVDLDLRDRRFGYPLEMVVRAAAQGWRIAELDIPYHPRIGRSKVTGTVKGTLRAISDMRRILAARA